MKGLWDCGLEGSGWVARKAFGGIGEMTSGW